MTQQLLPETPEKTQQHVEGRQISPDSAPECFVHGSPTCHGTKRCGRDNISRPS